MILTMDRKYSAWGGVYSILTYDLNSWWVMEREWRQNRRGVSCVPPGIYDLRPHNGTKYQNTWALVGPGVSHIQEPGVPRSACVLHRAEYPSQLKGCLTVCEFVSAEGKALGTDRAMGDIRRILSRDGVEAKLQILGR